MNGAADRSSQSSWQPAIMDPSLPCPSGLRCWNGSDPTRRFDVYRNNVVLSLVQALADSFPVTRALVGPEFFHALAARYVREEPPRSPVLAFYGSNFPAFIAKFRPADSIPYLAGVARLESARIRSYHAADDVVLTGSVMIPMLSRTPALHSMNLRLHPSVEIMSSAFAVVSIWLAHQCDDPDLSGVDPNAPEHALVTRVGPDVLVVNIDAETAAFITAIANGRSLQDASTRAFGLDRRERLISTLGLLLRLGAVAGLYGREHMLPPPEASR